ncbi:hypothetical protein CTEN210_00395 [Chaetoceros tenuissimus]|uniref:Uncharacterized protein n=1 Tax=Chaetoceros tenuissimus TaxID=426638 RepID=A0AAD3GYN3_9STRA|nr:hypothetical protein CTEN210_00395 [Chaetoceros tenuissimus]
MIFNHKIVLAVFLAAVSLPFTVNGNNNEDSFSEENVPRSSASNRMSLPMNKISKKQTNNRRLADDPPFWGSIFVDENVITDSSPNALQRVDMYDETRCVTMYDREVADWVQVDNAYIFDAIFTDGVMTQFWVRGSDFSSDEAKEEALKYAKKVGYLPQFLRKNARVAQILDGNYPWGGSPEGFITFYAGVDYSNQGFQNGGDISEETTVHEATHIIDPVIWAESAYQTAVTADNAYITLYAKNFTDREDVAESVTMWLGTKLGTMNTADLTTTRNTIPNRLAYFDSQDYNLFPLGDAGGGAISGYTWEKLSSFFYPCDSWDGGEDGGSKTTILDNACTDFPDAIKWKVQGVMTSLKCSDMTEYRCKKKKGKSLCPNACGTTAAWCGENLKDGKGAVEYGVDDNGETKFKGCAFVKRVADKIAERCSKGNVVIACRATCQNYQTY